ncbi:MAG: hypothetical protein OEW19_12715, partial [Acidobacteriota bacterium]|nr:hypothetical protein [Acidobacteriota bacterium]
MRPWTAWPALAASLVLLNASLTFGNVWPTPKIRWENALSVELAVGVLILALASQRARRLARWALPTIWVVLVVGHYLDVTAPGLYGRDFNLYWDSQHLGNVAAMLAKAVPAWLVAAALTALLLIVGVTWLAARAALERVAAAAAHPRPRQALVALSLAVIVTYVGIGTGNRAVGAPVFFADPVSGAYARQARFVLAMAGPDRAAPTLNASPRMDGAFSGLGGADVWLVFVEAYGAVTYDNPRFAEALAPSRAGLATAATEAGRDIVSAFVESPTFGASSWLAHLTLLTGVEVRDQYAYVAVMASARDTLPRAFRRQGYRSVALMPGMRQAWPEGAFYGFDHIYGREGLAYTGPKFGWWSIPDQYAMAKLDALEARGPGNVPRFVVFPTSTTHAPFGPVAPYQPDWSKVLTADAFAPDAVARAMAENPDLTNLSPSYLRAMAYEFTTFAGYVRQHAGDNLVMILIGDHQPV